MKGAADVPARSDRARPAVARAGGTAADGAAQGHSADRKTGSGGHDSMARGADSVPARHHYRAAVPDGLVGAEAARLVSQLRIDVLEYSPAPHSPVPRPHPGRSVAVRKPRPIRGRLQRLTGRPTPHSRVLWTTPTGAFTPAPMSRHACRRPPGGGRRPGRGGPPPGDVAVPVRRESRGQIQDQRTLRVLTDRTDWRPACEAPDEDRTVATSGVRTRPGAAAPAGR